MVKRTPPLALAVIGTGETSPKNVEALLNDYTSPYADVTFVLPVDDEHWTPTLDAVADWAKANDIPYLAVTDGSSPGKALVPLLDGAAEVIKVARVSTKMVQLLQQQVSEGEDAALLVAWDDDDAEANLAVQKALAADVKALNLLDGLDPFEFDEDDADGGKEEVRQEPAEKPAGRRSKAKDDEPAADDQPADDYDSWGIRKLRAALRESTGHGLTDRKIGALEKDEAIEALRKLDAKTDGPTADDEADADGGDEAQQPSRTTRARRAFAEGAGEGRGEDAPLPDSKGSDILDNETGDDVRGGVKSDTVVSNGSPYQDVMLRQRSLELAVQVGAGPDAVIGLAVKMETYLRGDRQSAGRPRADGTPAQPRERDEEGKPVRRRRASSSTE